MKRNEAIKKKMQEIQEEMSDIEKLLIKLIGAAKGIACTYTSDQKITDFAKEIPVFVSKIAGKAGSIFNIFTDASKLFADKSVVTASEKVRYPLQKFVRVAMTFFSNYS